MHEEVRNGAAVVAPIGLGQKGGIDHKGTGDVRRSSNTELAPFRRGQGKINANRSGSGRSRENKKERRLNREQRQAHHQYSPFVVEVRGVWRRRSTPVTVARRAGNGKASPRATTVHREAQA